MLNKLKKINWLEIAPILILVLIATFICIQNYIPGTYLSGWDTLHPEFNLSLYAKRVFFGAWQEHQGLGAPAAQAHLAEIVRLPILWFLSVLLPQSAIRYAFFFLMYIIGGLGTYVFIRHTWFKNEKRPIYNWSAFLGSLFYLLNLVTLQQFYVPLEMFAVHFATIGFVLWSVDKVIARPKINNFFIFFAIQIFTSPSAHTATLFYAYMFVVGVYSLSVFYAYHRDNISKKINILFKLAGLILVAHGYWMIPNFYYILFHNQYVSLAQISRNFSAEAFWQNQAFGNIYEVIIGKNFLFNWQDFDFHSKIFVDLFDEWRTHLFGKFGYIFTYFISTISIIGGLFSFDKNSVKKKVGIIVIFILSFFFLVNLNFPFTSVYSLLLKNQLLHEALRFPFTKFSILFIFSLSVFLASFCQYILNYFEQIDLKFQKNIFKTTFILFITTSIVYANLPALTGHLISDKMKIRYPENYFELFEWLENQPQQTRIVKMPINTYWGWVYQNWPIDKLSQGYQGAGFTWFGIPQPTLDREFDRWVNTNEFFYHEVDNDLKINNGKNLSQIFQKYDVNYILLDKSSINTSRSNMYQDASDTEVILTNLGYQVSWENDFLQVYKLNNQDNFINIPSSYTKISGDVEQVRMDTIYQNEKNYIDKKGGVIYPFEKFSAEDVSDMQYQSDTINISSNSINSSGIYQIQVDKNVDLVTLPVQVSYQNNQLSIQFTNLPLLKIDENIIKPQINPIIQIETEKKLDELILDIGLSQLKIKQNESQVASVVVSSNKNIDINFFDATKISTSSGHPAIASNEISTTNTNIKPSNLFLPSELINIKKDSQVSLLIPKEKLDINLPREDAINCGDITKGSVKNEYSAGIYKYEANKKGVNCASLELPLLNRQTYLLHVKGNNLAGRSIKLFINDDVSENVIFEELLPEGKFDKTFTVFTPDSDAFQYRLNLETRSFGQKSINEINQLEVYPLPLSFIINSKLVPQNTVYKFNNKLIIKDNWKMGTDRYGFSAINSQKTNQLFSLSQSFDPGWIAVAFPQNSVKISFLEHQKYNGWANSWFLPPGKYNVYIFYVPQFLSFQALFITLIFLLWFIFKIVKNMIYPKKRKYEMVQHFLLGNYHKKVM